MLKSVSLILIAASTVVTIGLQAADTQHEHSHAAKVNREPKLNHGKKWSTDPPLRKGMGEIKQSLEAKLQAIHAHRLSQEGYSALAEKVLRSVQYIFKHCRLPPDADANLHLILVPIMNAAKTMETPADLSQKELAAGDLAQALRLYGRYFSHPDWTFK